MKQWFVIVTVLVAAGLADAGVIYSNDFDEASGTAASETQPDTTIGSFISASSVSIITDGGGRLYCSAPGYNENYRFRVDPNPYALKAWDGMKFTVRLRVPSTAEWIGIGFHGANRNGLLTSEVNSGPWLQVGRSYVKIRGGHSTSGTGQIFADTYEAGTTNTLEFTYHFDNTVDLSVNGTILTNGMPVEHINEGETEPSDPVIGWLQIQFRQQDTVENGGAFVDDLTVETLDYVPQVTGDVIYDDDFSGLAGTALANSIPETSPDGYAMKSLNMALDGAGHVASMNGTTSDGFCINLGGAPLSDDPLVEAVKLTARLKTPTANWVGIGFAGIHINGLLHPDGNSGPWVKVNPTSVQIIGGNSTAGGWSTYFDTHVAGEVIFVELTYYPHSRLADFAVNGVVAATNIEIVHEYPAGTTNAPVLQCLSSTFFSQPTVAAGGPYIDQLRVETFEILDPYAAWAATYGLDFSESGKSDDPDGDGMDNFLEYAIGGNPAFSDASGVRPFAQIENDEVIYIYKRRLDAVSRGLTYSVLVRTDLETGSWTNIGTSAETGSGAVDADYESVTNSIPATNRTGFASLKVTGAE
ncbi:hypothetical protein [Tichowtungia aerotolerans]|uniref:Uncharacterized protein n=1 Tax=Tichowtungia aerotolerans TaxID=2697043 RepID=A0A6P1M7U0_9BACT|nr:hypothetical protein [Tichowtungia aerotolerans]QHI69937.1 hypothetical protein GT409_10900 [Tichowtungia aerotolerans]